jgi:hypothetical protein
LETVGVRLQASAAPQPGSGAVLMATIRKPFKRYWAVSSPLFMPTSKVKSRIIRNPGWSVATRSNHHGQIARTIPQQKPRHAKSKPPAQTSPLRRQVRGATTARVERIRRSVWRASWRGTMSRGDCRNLRHCVKGISYREVGNQSSHRLLEFREIPTGRSIPRCPVERLSKTPRAQPSGMEQRRGIRPCRVDSPEKPRYVNTATGTCPARNRSRRSDGDALAPKGVHLGSGRDGRSRRFGR